MSLLDRWFGRSNEPEQPQHGDPERLRVVRAVLNELAPMVAADGGEIQLIGEDDGWVEVRLRGACAHCSASDMTLFQALEPKLRAAAPWLRGVRRL